MNAQAHIAVSEQLDDVRYEIRGALARRAQELDRQGYEVLHLNIGNPGRFGFRTPETMRLAIIENLSSSEAYCHQKGIFPAREAVVMQQQNRGIMDVTVDDVIMGNGVSELIDLHLRALLNIGDEVLIPSPDYPLWTAAVSLNGGKAVHYPCPAENQFQPDLEALESLITDRTRALVVINPNNPTGAVYPRSTLEAMAELAQRHQLVMMSDEIYDQVLFDDAEFVPMATLATDTLCISFGGLSKVYRACGYRVGWSITSGNRSGAEDFLIATEMLASLRLCSNVPGQWAVQTALGGYQSVQELLRPGGRLYESRRTAIEAAARSPWLDLIAPAGALYIFPTVSGLDHFDDHQFAMRLLEQHHVLVVPGSSFHYPKSNALRLTILPDPETLSSAFERIEALLGEIASE
ncbi:MAG: aminotransferase class I/II-fold pyridoxal phosphate-dependent enzyme [Pseudomonadota bacterium]